MIIVMLFVILLAILFPRLLLALMLIGGIMILGEVHAKPARCILNVDGKTYINKICDSDFEKNGSFTLGTDNTPNGTGKRNKYFVYMNHNDDGTMTGYWNGIEAESHASGPLGNLSQLGACWTNEHAKVCAWKIGEQHDELDAGAPASEDHIGFPISDPTSDCRDCCGNQIATFNSCINRAQLYYNLAKRDWPDVSEKNRSYCVQLMSKSAPRGFYEGLEVCLNERLREQANETKQEFHY